MGSNVTIEFDEIKKHPFGKTIKTTNHNTSVKKFKTANQ